MSIASMFAVLAEQPHPPESRKSKGCEPVGSGAFCGGGDLGFPGLGDVAHAALSEMPHSGVLKSPPNRPNEI